MPDSRGGRFGGENCVAMSCACEKALFSKTVQETGKMTFLTLELSFGLLSLALKTTSLLSVVQGKYSEKGLQLNAISSPFSRRKKHCLPPYVPLRRGGLLMSKPPPPSLSNSLRLRLQVSVVSPKKARKNAVMTKVRLYLLCSRGVLLPSSEHHVPLALRTLHCNYLRAYCSFCIAGKKRPT